MYRRLSLVLVLSMLSNLALAAYRCQDANGYFSFSDKPCANDSAGETASVLAPPDSNSRPDGSAPGGEAYSRDVQPMRTPDAATQSCFSYMNTTARFPDPATTRLVSSSKKWVSVRNVGSRQMVTVGVTSKNEAGMYVGVQSFRCLMMGDGVTVNTGEYELL